MKLTKVFSYGTDSPYINRMVLQFVEMFNSHAFDLSQDKIYKIQEMLFDCGQNLVHIDEIVNNYKKIEDEAIELIVTGKGLSFQANAFSYDDPSLQLKKLFEDFLMRCIVVVRKKNKNRRNNTEHQPEKQKKESRVTF